MTPTSRNLMAVCVSTLALLSVAQACVQQQAQPPSPPGQTPTVTQYEDADAGVTCYLASSPHGLGISCVRDVVFAPAAPGRFVP